MIKILFFIESLEGGGAEKVLRNLVNNMDQTKFDITVQTVWPCDAKKHLAKGVKYKSIFSERNSINRFIYRAETSSGLTYRLHVHGDCDIEVAYLECGPTKVLSRSTNKRAVKIAWVHCDLQRMYARVSGFENTLRKQYERFNHVVCVSEDVRKAFAGIFGDLTETSVIYNTIDSEEIINKSNESMPDGLTKQKFTVVSVGRLTYQKAYDTLLKVCRRLLDDGLEFDLWIAGEGEEKAALKKNIEENDLCDSVKLLGFCDNPYSIMRAADLLVCSSRFEGFSTFATEAMILGKPFVTTECTGMRELLGDSEYGLITENNEEALYAGLKKMLLDSGLRAEYAGKASKRGKDFSSQKLVEANESFFIGVLNNEES